MKLAELFPEFQPARQLPVLAPVRGYSGWSLTMTKKQETAEGGTAAEDKGGGVAGAKPAAGTAIHTLVYFKVDEVRPLM